MVILRTASDEHPRAGDEAISQLLNVEALLDHQGKDAHEAHRHGESIPDQALVVRAPMIKGGTKADEEHTDGENKPSTPLILAEGKERASREQHRQTIEADASKRKIRKYIEGVRNAASIKRSLVSEVMIAKILWPRAAQEHTCSKNKREDRERYELNLLRELLVVVVVERNAKSDGQEKGRNHCAT